MSEIYQMAVTAETMQFLGHLVRQGKNLNRADLAEPVAEAERQRSNCNLLLVAQAAFKGLMSENICFQRLALVRYNHLRRV